MFDLYKKFKRDETRVQEGAPMVIGTTEDGTDVIIYVARMHQSNTQFKAYTENARRTLKRQIESASDDEANRIFEKIAEDALEHVCIKGWSQNMQDEQGALISFTPEAVSRLRHDLPELFSSIMDFASTSSNYVGTFDEAEAVKN